VLCEKNLIPVCIIKDGKVAASCVEFQRSDFTDEQLTEGLLLTLFKGRVTVAELKSESLYRDIRRAGGLRAGSLSLTFRLPAEPQPSTNLEALPEVTNPEKIKALAEFAEERLRTSARVGAREAKPHIFIRDVPPYSPPF
jgi:hypothetical protein